MQTGTYDRALVDAQPTVPEGKVRLGEYGQVDRRLVAPPLTLREGTWRNPHGVAFPARMLHQRRGFTHAGSCLRWQDRDVWSVSFTDRNGTTFGCAFETEAKARAYWTDRNITTTEG